MQLWSLGQGTVSPWSIVPRVPGCFKCFRQCWITSKCPNSSSPSYQTLIVGSTCNTLRQRGTMLHGDTVPCPTVQRCIVWTDLDNDERALIHSNSRKTNESLSASEPVSVLRLPRSCSKRQFLSRQSLRVSWWKRAIIPLSVSVLSLYFARLSVLMFQLSNISIGRSEES